MESSRHIYQWNPFNEEHMMAYTASSEGVRFGKLHELALNNDYICLF